MTGNPLVEAILRTSSRIGANPVDLGTVMSYETAGTFDPWKAGPTTQWGQHRGLIQMGEPQRAKYGVTQDTPVADQVEAAGNYLQDAGFRPGMGIMDLYSAVNAGRVGRYNASDANNGGAPGTVADKVNNQMAGHRAKAEALLGGAYTPPAGPTMTMPGATPSASGAFTPSGVEGSAAPAPAMAMPADKPSSDTPIDAAKILQSLLGSQQVAAQPPAQPSQSAPSPLQAIQRQGRPFDTSAFFALLRGGR